ncbi:MAG: TetR/AcrR family transcriptional regulator [Deltaproteobacteria bacterium]|nr:MAG: TetR/AcrR family transcriptional regulator [Deltaproteobacteria bacterium]
MFHESASRRTERRRRARRDQIVDAALALAADRGIDGVTIGALAEALDYTPGALYRYFPSKEALFEALEARAIDEMAEHVAGALAGVAAAARAAAVPAAASAVARVLAAADAYVAVAELRPHAAGLVGQLLGTPRQVLGDAAAARVAPAVARLVGAVAGAVADAAASGALTPGDARARTADLWAAVHGAVSLGKLARFDRLAADAGAELGGLFDARARAASLSRALLSGWGAAQDVVDRASAVVSDWRESWLRAMR